MTPSYPDEDKPEPVLGAKALREALKVPARSSVDMRRLTGLWRFGVAVLPPTCKDFYAWLDVLDAAIDERTSRIF